MNSVVIYGSRFGNTRRVASAIATELAMSGPVQLFAADDAPSTVPAETDLIVIGGPIEALRMTPPVAHLLARLERRSVEGIAAAAFETRLRPHWWLPGSASKTISRRLRGLGARPIAPPESFLVEGSINEAKGEVPELVAGELERAASWATSLAAAVKATTHNPVNEGSKPEGARP